MPDDKQNPPKVQVGGREPKTKDSVCRVRVYLSGTDSKTKKNLKDNISSAVYINGDTVSNVQKKIIAAFSGTK